MSRSRNKPYHHGDLKRALLEAAKRLLEFEGTDALSFRRLAELVGVSHAAPLAHFPDRRCLDASLASQGFRELQDRLKAASPGGRPPAAGGFQPLKPLQEEDREKPQPGAPEWRLASPSQPAYFHAAAAPVPSRAAFPPPRGREPGKYGARLAATFLAYLRFAFEHPGLFRAMHAPALAEAAGSPDPGDQAAACLLELQQERAEAASVFADLVALGQKAGEFRGDLPPERVGRLWTALAEGLAHQYLAEGGTGPGRLKEAEQLFGLLLQSLTE